METPVVFGLFEFPSSSSASLFLFFFFFFLAYNLIRLMSGPRVDIYVGPQKKHFSLPKKLLCYYSEYFQRCLNSNFIESQTQRIDLDQDNIEYFNILVEYMSTGMVMCNALYVFRDGPAGMQECMNFLDYVDKYGMGDAAFAVQDSLERVIRSLYTYCNGYKLGVRVQPCHVETVFRVTPPGHPLRTLITKAAMSTAGMTGAFFHQQEQEVDGFAAALLTQMRNTMVASGQGMLRWPDPFTGTFRKN